MFPVAGRYFNYFVDFDDNPANKITLWKRCDNVVFRLWKRLTLTFRKPLLVSFLNVCITF